MKKTLQERSRTRVRLPLHTEVALKRCRVSFVAAGFNCTVSAQDPIAGFQCRVQKSAEFKGPCFFLFSRIQKKLQPHGNATPALRQQYPCGNMAVVEDFPHVPKNTIQTQLSAKLKLSSPITSQPASGTQNVLAEWTTAPPENIAAWMGSKSLQTLNKKRPFFLAFTPMR